MTNDEKISSNNYLQCEKLLNLLMQQLETRFNQKEFNASDVDGNKFEKVVFDTIKIVQRIYQNELFSNWITTLVSGRKFPDIVLEINEQFKFGIEVKTSKGKDWKTLGGSIMESTRVDEIENIFIVFAKLDPFQVRYKSFDACVVDVAVTHSPRYIIDLDISNDETIFKKINTNYRTIWTSEKPFEHFREYFKEKATREKTGLWWIGDDDSRNADDLPSVQIQFFSKLPQVKKDYLTSKSMILFPSIFANVADYDEISVWLVNMGILNNSLRDTYSAGEKQYVLGFNVPSKFRRLNERIPEIISIFKNIELESALIDKFETKVSVVAYEKWVTELKIFVSSEYQPFIDEMLKAVKFT